MKHSLITSILYALACILVPVAWGLLAVWLTSLIERRLRARGAPEVPPIEYHI
jgi:predicted PurR-regulated permease PerM